MITHDAASRSNALPVEITMDIHSDSSYCDATHLVDRMRGAPGARAGIGRRIALAAGLAFGAAVAAAHTYGRVSGASPTYLASSSAAVTSRVSAASKPALSTRGMSQAEFEKLDCKTRWRVYRESLDCFAPYTQRPPYVAPPEAYEKCGVNFKDPSHQCGIEGAPHNSR